MSPERLVAALAAGNPAVMDPVLSGLARGWPKDRQAALSAEGQAALARLFTRISPQGQSQLLQLAGRWGAKGLEQHAAEIAESLLAIARDPDRPDEARVAAAGQLVEFRRQDPGVAQSLLEIISPRTSPVLAGGIVEAIARSEAAEAAASLVERLGSLTPAVRSQAIKALLGARNGLASCSRR